MQKPSKCTVEERADSTTPGKALICCLNVSAAIGMRKVLGASVFGIVGLLSKDLLKLIVIGFVLSVPLTWYVMNRWLENFAYRVDVGIFTLLNAGVMAIVIALATVSWQSLKAASANPVNSLRSE